MTYDEIVEFGLTLPDVEESVYYGDPALKRKRRFMLGIREEGVTMAVKLDWESHDALMSTHPEVFYKTPHYDGWPILLVRLEIISRELAEEVVQLAWADAPKPTRIRK